MRLLSVLVYCMFTLISSGQISFFNIYSDSGDDFGEGIVQLEDSSYVITGSSSSFGFGPSDAFLLKIDSLGNYLWSKNYGGTESDNGRRVLYNPGDGFYVAGTTNSFGNGAYDFYLFKTDLNGDLVWEKTYGGSGWEKLNDAVLTNDGHIIFVGESSSNINQDRQGVIYKLNLSGDSIFTIQSNHTGIDFLNSLTYYQDSMISVTGPLYDSDSSKWKSSISTYHIDGTLIWTDTLSINGDCKIQDLTYSNSELFLVGGVNTSDFNSFGRYRVKYGLNGSLISQNSSNTSIFYTDKDICEFGNTGDFIISFEYEDDAIPGNGLDLAIWKYGFPFTNLNQWTPVPYVNDDKIGQTIKTLDNSVISVGTTSSYNQSYNNVFVSKIGPGSQFPNATAPHNTQSLVRVVELESDHIIISPNPTDKQFSITGQEGAILELSIVSMGGMVVLKTKETNIDVSTLNPGVYVVNIFCEQGVFKKRLVIR